MSLKSKSLPIFLAVLLGCSAAAAVPSDKAAPEILQVKIAPGDVLHINVYKEPDLSGVYEVNEHGFIKYPLIGQIKAAGCTRYELESTITQLLQKDYLYNPLVNISFRSSGEAADYKKQVMVLGCVKSPGTYTFSSGERITLMKALSASGGFTSLAAQNDTRIIRASAGGEKKAINPRVDRILKGKQIDIELEPGDLIFVPERIF